MCRRIAVVCAVALAAAFSSWGAAPAQAPAKTVPAKKWVKTFCNTIADWSETAIAGADDLDFVDAEDPVAVRGQLVAYIDDVSDETTVAIKRIKRAGAPKVKNGKKIATTARRGFVAIRDAMDEASEIAADMPVDSVAGTQAASAEARAEIKAGSEAFYAEVERVKRLDKGGLARAMKKNSTCRRLGE